MSTESQLASIEKRMETAIIEIKATRQEIVDERNSRRTGVILTTTALAMIVMLIFWNFSLTQADAKINRDNRLSDCNRANEGRTDIRNAMEALVDELVANSSSPSAQEKGDRFNATLNQMLPNYICD